MRQRTIIFLLAVLAYITLVGISLTNGTFRFYWPDAAFFAAFIFFLHLTFGFWRLNVPIYILLVLSLVLHLCGIFGWYSVSPFPCIKWDHITHGIPLFSFTLFLYNFARQWMADQFWSARTWGILLLVFLSGLGIGAVIENIEFIGYLTLGFGEGGLFFGGPGDGQPVTSAQMDIIQDLGGGYINTEVDLVWNFIGVFSAIVLMSIIRFGIRKKVPSAIEQSFPQAPSPSAFSWQPR